MVLCMFYLAGSANDFDRTLGVQRNRLGDASQQQTVYAASAVGADYDQVCVPFAASLRINSLGVAAGTATVLLASSRPHTGCSQPTKLLLARAACLCPADSSIASELKYGRDTKRVPKARRRSESGSLSRSARDVER